MIRTRAELDSRGMFEVEQTATYAREEELYVSYLEGMSEAEARVAVTKE
jgi:hypothetical protein